MTTPFDPRSAEQRRELKELLPENWDSSDVRFIPIRVCELGQLLGAYEEMEKALRKYGRHHISCVGGGGRDPVCTCGLAAALEGKP